MLGKCERRLWKQQEHGGYGIPEWLAGSKRVQVKGGMLLLAAYPWKTPTGKAVREIWFEYFWKRRSKEDVYKRQILIRGKKQSTLMEYPEL